MKAHYLFLCILVCLARSAIAAPERVQVTDDIGTLVSLTEPARRIVSLAPHITEMLFAAGAGDKVVGTVAYSDFPEAAKTIPQVGSYQQLDFERILALQPDLIIGWASGNPAGMLNRLRDLGLPLYLSEPRTLEDIASNIERLGALTGTRRDALRAVRPFREQVQKLREQYADAEPVSVFYEIWNQPLMTLNGEHIVSRVMDLCGGVNVFAQQPTLAPAVGIEAVLEKNPQAIIGSGTDHRRPPWLDEWQRWPQLQAVQNNHLFAIPPDFIQRHSLRIIQGAEMLCEQLKQVRENR